MSSSKIKVYLIAGEPSGDLLGSRLMRALKQKGNVDFYGVGGDTMKKEGLNSLFNISDLAIMGLLEVVPSIPRVLKRIQQTVDDIINIKPDIVVTIDSWSFCSRVHKKLRKLNLGFKQVHYVAPQVWAWKAKRAKTMYKYIDYLLTLLPNEPKYFTPYNLPTEFVGHPVVESSVLNADGKKFCKEHNIDDSKQIISILPGSRHNEVAKLLPDFLETANLLHKKYPNMVFILPTVSTVAKQVREATKNSDLPLIVVDTQDERYGAFRASDAAIAASGTVALELAMCKVPHIVAYKVSKLTYLMAKYLVHIKYVNLTNIMLKRLVVPELLQHDCVPEKISDKIEELLQKKSLYKQQMQGFDEVRTYLTNKDNSPSAMAADIIIRLAK